MVQCKKKGLMSQKSIFYFSWITENSHVHFHMGTDVNGKKVFYLLSSLIAQKKMKKEYVLCISIKYVNIDPFVKNFLM